MSYSVGKKLQLTAKHNSLPVHVNVTIFLELFSELGSQDGMVLLGEITKSILHSLHELLLAQDNRSLGSVGDVGVQRLPIHHFTSFTPTAQGEDPGGFL